MEMSDVESDTGLNGCLNNKSSPKSFGKSNLLLHNYAIKYPLVTMG